MAAAADFIALLIALLFITLVSATIGNLPVIGPPIRAWCNSLQPKFAAIKQTLLVPIEMLSLFFTYTIRQAVKLGEYLPSRVLSWINDAEAAVVSQVTQLRNRVLNWVNSAEAAVSAEVTSLQSRVLHWVNDAESALRTEMTAMLSRVLSWVNGAEATLRKETTAAVDDVRSWFTKQIGFLQDALVSFQQRALQWVNQGEADVRTEIAADYGNLSDMIKALQQALASDRSAEIADVAAVAAAVAGVTAALSDLEKNCINNLCFNLKDLADTIASMDEAAELAALIGILSEAAADPGAAANTVEDLFGSMVSDVNSVVSHL